MSILIADDDAVSRCMLECKLREWGHEVQVVFDGAAALDLLRRPDAPPVAILDWIMPEIDGLEVCQRTRALGRLDPTYLILLTVKGAKADIIAGLEGGADDYLPKPFDWGELRARLSVGLRLVELQRTLCRKIHELQESQKNVKVLQGLLPICGYCKKIRDDQNYWRQLEAFLCAHADIRFTHGICPGCYETIVKPEIAAARE
jgi:sigma-B regulation protein RsbU (phosphoserine phosphatase)